MSEERVPPLPKSSSGINGCLIGCLIVFVIGVAGVAIVAWFSYQSFQGAINDVTEPEPRELPALDVTEEERTAANEKFDRFQAAMESGGEEKEFSFTGEEINVMLRSNPDTSKFGDSVYVTIANGELRGEVSLNLGAIIPLGMFEGRYANGSATFNVYAQNDRLFVFVESFQMKGEDAPAELVQQIRTQNLAQDIANDPQMGPWIQKIDEINVVEDKLVVTLK